VLDWSWYYLQYLLYTSRHGTSCLAGLISIHCFPLSLLLFHNHRSLPVPIRGYRLQTLRVTFILISGRSGDSNHVDVRPTSVPSCKSYSSVFHSPRLPLTTTFSIFRITTYFFRQHFCSLTYNDDNRALHGLSTDSTMTSLVSPPSCSKGLP